MAHIYTRNTIERAFGVLKKRFPCLSFGLRLQLQPAWHVLCYITEQILMKNKPIRNDNVYVDDMHDLFRNCAHDNSVTFFYEK